MAKNTPAKKEEGDKALTKFDYGEMSGKGFDNVTNEDLSIPFIAILQAQSPQVHGKEKKPGASAGMLMNTVTEEFFDGETDGLVVVPCYTDHLYTEWVPRDNGGGFAGRHELDSEVVQHCRANQKFGEFKTEHGNDLVETFYLYCLLLADEDAPQSASPAILAFTSTKIKKYRATMSKIRMMEDRPPLFAFKLRVKTVEESNKHGSFYNYELLPTGKTLADSMIDPSGDQAPLLEEATGLIKAIKGGKAKAAYESQDAVGSDDATGPAPF